MADIPAFAEAGVPEDAQEGKMPGGERIRILLQLLVRPDVEEVFRYTFGLSQDSLPRK
jgi:hypothetical protein